MFHLLKQSALVAEEACERVRQLVTAEDRPLPSDVHWHDGEVACGTADSLVVDRQQAN
jgi:hypothetical protein